VSKFKKINNNQWVAFFDALSASWHALCNVLSNERSACSFITHIKALEFTKGALE
jgi:hypothetical protein